MIEPRIFAPPHDHDAALADMARRMRPEPWTPEYRAALETAQPQSVMLHVRGKRGGLCERSHSVRVLGDAGGGCVAVLVEGEREPRRISRARVA